MMNLPASNMSKASFGRHWRQSNIVQQTRTHAEPGQVSKSSGGSDNLESFDIEQVQRAFVEINIGQQTKKIFCAGLLPRARKPLPHLQVPTPTIGWKTRG